MQPRGQRYVVVEGRTDRAVVWRHLRSRGATVRPLEGKANVLAFARQARRGGLSNAISVVDRNGWTVDGLPAEIMSLCDLNLAVTQHRDMEMDLLRSTDFGAVEAEFFNPEVVLQVEHELGMSLRDAFIVAAAPLGAVRLAVEHMGLGVRVNRLAGSVAFDERRLRLPLADVVAALPLEEPERTAVEREADQLLSTNPAVLLACGHDVMALVARSARRGLGSTGRCRAEDVERTLRASTSTEAFLSTPVGQALNGWLGA